MENPADDLGIETHKSTNKHIGYPSDIGISCKVACPWKSQCKNAVDGFQQPLICVNYNPSCLIYGKESLKCSNWEVKEEQAPQPKEVKKNADIRKPKNSKKIRK